MYLLILPTLTSICAFYLLSYVLITVCSVLSIFSGLAGWLVYSIFTTLCPLHTQSYSIYVFLEPGFGSVLFIINFDIQTKLNLPVVGTILVGQICLSLDFSLNNRIELVVCSRNYTQIDKRRYKSTDWENIRLFDCSLVELTNPPILYHIALICNLWTFAGLDARENTVLVAFRNIYLQ